MIRMSQELSPHKQNLGKENPGTKAKSGIGIL